MNRNSISYDIIRVCRPDLTSLSFRYYQDGELIYEEEDIVKSENIEEYTVSELEEILRKKIKIKAE